MSLTHISKIIYLKDFLFPPPLHPNKISFPTSASSFESSPSLFAKQTEAVVAQLKSKLSRSITHPDLKTLQRLNKFNQLRLAQGKGPLPFQKITQEIESISKQSINNKEKKQQIEKIRKQFGLSKGQMKKLFTGRLGKLYKDAEKSLKTYQKTKQTQLQQELQQAEQSFGPNSPQAQEIQQKMAILQNTLQPQQQEWNAQAGFYKSLYPSFWSKLGGFFKKIGSGFLKALSFVKPFLSFIPVVGPIASLAVRGVETLVKAIKTKGKSLLGAGLDFLKSKIPSLSDNFFKRETRG